jgi:hypothetical protein
MFPLPLLLNYELVSWNWCSSTALLVKKPRERITPKPIPSQIQTMQGPGIFCLIALASVGTSMGLCHWDRPAASAAFAGVGLKVDPPMLRGVCPGASTPSGRLLCTRQSGFRAAGERALVGLRGSLERSVAEAMRYSEGWPFLEGMCDLAEGVPRGDSNSDGNSSRIYLDDDVVFESAFHKLKGKDEYLRESKLWKDQLHEEVHPLKVPNPLNPKP